MSKDLPEFPGKEGLMITVVYPLGASDPIHRHNAHAFLYVLEGSVVMQVKGGKEITLTPGQTFYQGPNDVHVIGRNASNIKPAKFVVFLVKDKDAPVLVQSNDDNNCEYRRSAVYPLSRRAAGSLREKRYRCRCCCWPSAPSSKVHIPYSFFMSGTFESF